MPPHRDRDIEISKASLIAKRRALLKSLAEDSFHDFVRQAWAIVEPDVEYRDNWHIGALCDHLSAVNDGKIKQLLINVPPGAMKSLLVCVFWPAWVWAKSPAKRFLFASYSDGLEMNAVLAEYGFPLEFPKATENAGDLLRALRLSYNSNKN